MYRDYEEWHEGAQRGQRDPWFWGQVADPPPTPHHFLLPIQGQCGLWPLISTKQTATYHLKLLKTKNNITYDIGNPRPAQKCGKVKPVHGISAIPSDNWILNNMKELNKQSKTSTDSLPLKKITHYHKNEWQHKHGQYNSRVNECT